MASSRTLCTTLIQNGGWKRAPTELVDAIFSVHISGRYLKLKHPVSILGCELNACVSTVRHGPLRASVYWLPSVPGVGGGGGLLPDKGGLKLITKA